MSNTPSAEDLRALPLRSLVAYAARAAQRVRPLVDSASDDGLAAVSEKAVAWAVAFAADDGFDLDEATRAEEELVTTLGKVGESSPGGRLAALAANSAYAAVHAAIAAHAVPDSKSPTNSADEVVSAVGTAVEAARSASTHTRHGLVRDFEQLSRRARAPFPQLGNPVDVRGSGPLGKVGANRKSGPPEPNPNDVDLLEILRLREELERERANVDVDRAELDTTRLEIDRERRELEELSERVEREKSELDREREKIEEERRRARAIFEDLDGLLRRHGPLMPEQATEPTSKAATMSEDDAEALSADDDPSIGVESEGVAEPELVGADV